METVIYALNYVISWLAVIGLLLLFVLIAIVARGVIRAVWRQRAQPDRERQNGQETPLPPGKAER